MEYIIITAAKNEAKNIGHTLRSVCTQTVKPKKWIIVDDGSSDDTAKEVEDYVGRYEYIRLIKNVSGHEERMGGSKVVRAFYVGYESIRHESWDIVAKLDADLTLPLNYFEEVIKCFEMNPHIGLCGGYCIILKNGRYVKESYSDDHVRGALKAYRRECFRDIGGLRHIWSWDGIDEWATTFHGWGFRVLPLPVIHHRPTSKEYSLLRYSYKTGREMYKERANLFSLIVNCLVNAPRKPAIIGSMLYLAGYLVSWVNREDKVIDKDLGDYINMTTYRNVAKRIRFYKPHETR